MPKSPREERLKYFNLTVEDEEKILVFQNRVCAICKKNIGKKGQPLTLFIDHNHVSGLTRGYLCFSCNRMVGSLTIENCQKILEYLLNPPVTQALGAPRVGMPGRVGTKKMRKLYKKLQKANVKNPSLLPESKKMDR